MAWLDNLRLQLLSTWNDRLEVMENQKRGRLISAISGQTWTRTMTRASSRFLAATYPCKS